MSILLPIKCIKEKKQPFKKLFLSTTLVCKLSTIKKLYLPSLKLNPGSIKNLYLSVLCALTAASKGNSAPISNSGSPYKMESICVFCAA